MSDESLGKAVETLIDQEVLRMGQSPLYGAVIPFVTQQMILNYLEKKERLRFRGDNDAYVNYRLSRPYRITKDGQVIWGDLEIGRADSE